MSLNMGWIPFVAYVLGSIPFGLLVARLRGRGDIRQAGSGNIGAANVTRVAGASAGLLTLLLDAGKGALAVWLASRFTGQNVTWMMIAGVGAILGHLFPMWLRFQGGRGVATGAGAFLLICPQAVGGAMVLWILVVGFWRYASLGSIAAAAALPLLTYLLWAPGHAPPHAVSAGALLAASLIIWKHRPNIERLLAGTEPKLTVGRK